MCKDRDFLTVSRILRKGAIPTPKIMPIAISTGNRLHDKIDLVRWGRGLTCEIMNAIIKY